MAASVLDLVRAAIGVEEDEGLPPDITRDIIAKYTFLDPTDVVKWTRDAKYGKGGGEDSSDEGDEDFDLESDMEEDEESSSDEGSEDISLDDLGLGEKKATPSKRIREAKQARLRELSTRYASAKEDIYFRVLKENVVDDFVRDKRHIHMNKYSGGPTSSMLEALAKKRPEGERLMEVSMKDVINQIREDNSTN